MVCNDVEALVQYGIDKALIAGEDRVWARNQLLAALSLDGFAPEDGCVCAGEELDCILSRILDDAERRGLIPGGVVSRDLLDTKLMGVLTPRPRQSGPTLDDGDGVRRAGDIHQPLQARKGPARHRRRAAGEADGLSQVPALPRGGGLRRAHRLSRAGKSPPHPAHSRRGGLVFAVFPLCLL